MDEKDAAGKKAGEATAESGMAKEAAPETGDKLEEDSAEAALQYREYQPKLLAAARANVDAVFGYAHDAIRAQSVAELMEVSGRHSRQQIEKMTEQAREIVDAAQKLANEAARRS